ncbi:hypothetical protein [Thermococcus paralvinellae]|uniref:Uncharacterized protein n=1 Tax=Thermococcus paralvinellae TaxID=582419 RepID=W0I9S9_9EURY|nr:hypothetical protein [Thermococcus paralvinellae]AHF81230.1 Hypothetical protein TES1_1855 [Thermococcus paralvinellae]
MKKLLGLLPLLLLIGLISPMVKGSPTGDLLIDLNVTLVNPTPFPKFVVVNPQYNYTVYREPYNEIGKLNSLPGFWINPYESLKVNVVINDTILIPANYTSKNTNIFQGIVYPKLVVLPKLFKINDVIMGDIMIVEYHGNVKMRVKNSPYDGRYVFAVGMPVIFMGATHYDFVPKYTMWFRDYFEFLKSYLPLKTYNNESTRVLNITKKNSVLFSLSDRLITGKTLKKNQIINNEEHKLDFPIWIVWLGEGSIEISYQVKWENMEKVNSSGGKEKEKIWFILDKRDIE